MKSLNPVWQRFILQAWEEIFREGFVPTIIYDSLTWVPSDLFGSGTGTIWIEGGYSEDKGGDLSITAEIRIVQTKDGCLLPVEAAIEGGVNDWGTRRQPFSLVRIEDPIPHWVNATYFKGTIPGEPLRRWSEELNCWVKPERD